ncbi:MAG: hypothetical protein OEX12_13955 [Gammaproteobacteria bacterium]|nr:hypothetical protein [Gammaproteobacteria bacterium]
MAVKILPPKGTKTQEQVTQEDLQTVLTNTFGPQIDSMVAIEIEAKSLEAQAKKLKAQVDEFRSDVKKVVEEHHPNEYETFQVYGQTHSMTIGKVGEMTQVNDKEAMYHAFEDKKAGLFFDVCKINLTDIKKYLGEDLPFLEKIFSGVRKITFK